MTRRIIELSNNTLRAVWLRLYIWCKSWRSMRAGRSLLALLKAPAWQLWRGYRREVDRFNSFVEGMGRSAEWLALKDWWSCRQGAEYEAAKKRWGRVLQTARAKWYQTDRYKQNKRRYQR